MVMEKKVKVSIIGNIFGITGYALHTKNLSQALFDLGMDVRIETYKPDQWERDVSDSFLEMVGKEFDPDCCSIMIAQPQFWRFALADKPKKFFGVCVFEGDVVPDYWLPYLMDERVDKILVPSQHTKDAIMETMFKNAGLLDLKGIKIEAEGRDWDKIEIVPHGFDPKHFYPEKKTEKIFTFVANKGWSQGLYDRGGIQWLLEAFSKEFKKGEDVQLWVKINPVYNQPGWDISKEMAKLDIDPDHAKFFTTQDVLSEKGLRDFYNKGDVFVSPSMADAYNLGCVEAMACGLPVITSEFGGQSDFVTPQNGVLLEKGELVAWSKEEAYKGVKWFKPDIKDLQDKLRFAFENRKEMAEKGKIALEDSKKHTWKKSAENLKALI